MEIVLVYITAANEQEALRMGRVLIEKKMAACVNVLPNMRSVYRWEGKIEEASESVLIAKTTPPCVGVLMAEIKKIHSYDCPCMLTIPVTGGHPPYVDWLLGNLL